MSSLEISLNADLFSRDDKILLAISAGVDSMVMLDLFLKTNIQNLGIAHINYGLRGKASDEDERLVQVTAKLHDLAFHNLTPDMKTYTRTNQVGVQEAARFIRYEWFYELVNEHGYTKIATAHHQLDRAETFLFNLSRGSGLRGLSSIPSSNRLVIRPLLHVSKESIVQYAQKFQVNFREDHTNKELYYTRNIIRSSVIPTFKSIQARAIENINKSADLCHQYQLLIDHFIENEKHKWIKNQSNRQLIHLSKIPDDHIFVILYELLRYTNIRPAQISDLIVANKSAKSGIHVYTPTHRINLDRSSLIIQTQQEKRIVHHEILPGLNQVIGTRITMHVERSDYPAQWPKTNHVVYLDGDNISFPLILRNWQPGDRFKPLGMKGKTKKIQDFLTDLKLSRPDKENILVLVSGEEICWVVGYQIAEPYKIQVNNKLIYKLKIEKKGADMALKNEV